MSVLRFPPSKSEPRTARPRVAEGPADTMPPGLDPLCALIAVFFGVPTVVITDHGDPVMPLCVHGGAAEHAMLCQQLSQPTQEAQDVVHLDAEALATAGAPADMRFFVAVPLLLHAGERAGALCIADSQTRPFTPDDLRHLRGYSAVAAAVVQARRALDDAHVREQLLARASRLARVGGWEYNVETGGLTLSEQAMDIYGLEPSTKPTLDMMLRRFYPGDALIDTREDLARILRDGKGYDSRRRIQRLDGTSRWIHALAEPELRDGRVVRVHGLIEDITEEVEAQRRFHELAYIDKLTGLPNRGAFLLELGRRFVRAEPISLVAIDIDGFKEVNDTLGHHAGDQLLTDVSQRIAGFFPVGTFAARIGSNEFAVIANAQGDSADSDILSEVDQLRLALKAPMTYPEYTLMVSVSIGVSEAPRQAADADQLIRSADIALYQAKKAGGDCSVMFEPKMRDHLEERVQLLRDVRIGIARGEFILYYQPIYDMRSQTLSGFEALMRWSRPERGILSPAVFSAAFDDQTLAPALGNVALHAAFSQMQRWNETGFDFGRVSVNVAAAQFYTGDLAEQILSLLKKYGLNPRQLTLEITESVYLGQGSNAVESTLRTLHDAGIHIALDDFGTGYASLSQLQRFPIDSLKIDKSFVQEPDAQSIVDAIIALGTSMNLDIVAEGVETRAHQEQLLQSGCRYGQGHFYGKPMPAEFYG
ncbi:putative bifunctional diguanylate cyclase/phosphodiesterase [Achromobacter aloeverae]|uniref:GGDEF domain-containing protein n=1 Tax=Achromobacter aloeverae TaxID=1750518 RepID=A0A4Q1HJC1_9BURK|nr:EAL domain-containing protein [Achromobacter aloeverae]RXN87793.1 GGDEF domain-containing protein [Achromobacter aloeverae]